MQQAKDPERRTNKAPEPATSSPDDVQRYNALVSAVSGEYAHHSGQGTTPTSQSGTPTPDPDGDHGHHGRDHDHDHDWGHNYWPYADQDDFHHPRFFVPIYTDRPNYAMQFVFGTPDQPYVVVVRPGQNVVFDSVDSGSYSYTAVALDDNGLPLAGGAFYTGSVAYGSFQQVTYTHVSILISQTIVQNNVTYINYNANPAYSDVVDCGPDPTQGVDGNGVALYRRVMIDKTSAAWGTWNADYTDFTVVRTQDYPAVSPVLQQLSPSLVDLVNKSEALKPQAQTPAPQGNGDAVFWMTLISVIAVGGAGLVCRKQIGEFVGRLFGGAHRR